MPERAVARPRARRPSPTSAASSRGTRPRRAGTAPVERPTTLARSRRRPCVPSGRSSTFAARRPPCAMRCPCSRPRFAPRVVEHRVGDALGRHVGRAARPRVRAARAARCRRARRRRRSRPRSPAHRPVRRAATSTRDAPAAGCACSVERRARSPCTRSIARPWRTGARRSRRGRSRRSTTAPPSGAAATKRVSPHTCSAASVEVLDRRRRARRAPAPTWSQRRCRGRGPDDEVERGRDAPRERDAGNDVVGQCRRARTSAPSAPSDQQRDARVGAPGRSRYGAATSSTVVATASTMTGYSGLEPCDRQARRPARRDSASTSAAQADARRASRARPRRTSDQQQPEAAA